MSDKFKVALVQTCAGNDMQETLGRAAEMAKDAASQGAQLLQFAEFFSCYDIDEKGIHTGPLPEESHPALPLFADLARDLKVWMNLGSITVPAPDGRAYNRQYVIDDQGIVRATYEKIHLFDVNLGADDRYRESASLAPGERAVLVDTPWGKMGLSICYDVRFPHLYRDLAKAGADFLTVPAAFTHKTGQDHWHILLRARAIETGCFVFATCQSGYHGKSRTYGHSLIVGPWGEILAEGPEDEEAVVIAEIDPAEVAKVRGRIPSLKHDRPYDKPEAVIDNAAE
ncbi:MAG: carbon-nitrogen hydrolase family protein [Rhodospirillales bacterium]|nr:carbon-nitrogen hydrolase family protein [Rhodospirillales bacterium]